MRKLVDGIRNIGFEDFMFIGLLVAVSLLFGFIGFTGLRDQDWGLVAISLIFLPFFLGTLLSLFKKEYVTGIN